MRRTTSTGLAGITLAFLLGACSGAATPTPPPTPEPTPVATAEPTAAPAADLPHEPSLAPGASFLPETTPTPEESEGPSMEPTTSPDIVREAAAGMVNFCVYGWSFDMGGPIINGIGYDGSTPICRSGKATGLADVAMYADYVDSSGPVKLRLGAYLPAGSNQIEVTIRKVGGREWSHTERVGPGGSKVFRIQNETYKIWESGGDTTQLISPNINLEFCVFHHCSH